MSWSDAKRKTYIMLVIYCSGWFLQLNILWYAGATDNLFDLRDRELDGDREVLDTGGVPAKGIPTVKSVNMMLGDLRGMQSRVQMIMEQKKMLP